MRNLLAGSLIPLPTPRHKKTDRDSIVNSDQHMMKIALGLARRGLGLTWPNPSVGCVITDRKGHIVGRGLTGRGGRPHGETRALSQAGEAAHGGTAFVTLEPCAHHGKTPPCAEALIAAGLARVVVATLDPDSRVSGRGIALLEQAGIEVETGICQTEADQINQGFFKRCAEIRPMVTVKIASSLDGRIASASGHSQWITGPESRRRGHLLRATHDAILVGVGTVLADNPSLDCRLAGLEDRSPLRVVMDSHLRIPEDCQLVMTAQKIPTWVITSGKPGRKSARLEKSGVKVIFCDCDDQGRVDMASMLNLLGQAGLTRLLSEGGAQVNASLIRASLVDRLYWFRSPSIIGGDGLAALPSIGVEDLADIAEFSLVRTGQSGKDSWQELATGL